MVLPDEGNESAGWAMRGRSDRGTLSGEGTIPDGTRWREVAQGREVDAGAEECGRQGMAEAVRCPVVPGQPGRVPEFGSPVASTGGTARSHSWRSAALVKWPTRSPHHSLLVEAIHRKVAPVGAEPSELDEVRLDRGGPLHLHLPCELVP